MPRLRTTLWLLSAATILGGSFTSSDARPVDPFINTIQRVKQSVAPVVCLRPGADGAATYLGTAGTAFFTSEAGEFVTAAHVLSAEIARPSTCPIAALYLPARGWTDEPTFKAEWLRFTASKCAIDSALDVALCQTDVPPASRDLTVVPVTWRVDPPLDGTPVAFTGFPLQMVRPVTARATLAAFQPGFPGADLIIDKNAWPGVSGGPVYLETGEVIGMVLRRGQNEGVGLTFARSSAKIRQFVAAHPRPQS